MTTLLLISTIVLWLTVLGLAFLLLGTLRALGLLSWRLEQLEATTPSRLGRDGLKVGKKAPDFTLASVANGAQALRDFAGRKTLLVFTQSGCGPCKTIVPELNRLHDHGDCRVAVVSNGEPDHTRRWAEENGARFPVLIQEKLAVSKRYQVFATPFAFLLDEQGIITSKGIAGSRQHLGYVLSGARGRARQHHEDSEESGPTKSESEANHFSKEVSHV